MPEPSKYREALEAVGTDGRVDCNCQRRWTERRAGYGYDCAITHDSPGCPVVVLRAALDELERLRAERVRGVDVETMNDLDGLAELHTVVEGLPEGKALLIPLEPTDD